MGFNWTAEAVSVLSAAWLAKEPASVIADKLGASRNAIIGKARRIGLPQHAHAYRRGVNSLAKGERPKIQRRDRFRIPKVADEPLPAVVAPDPLNISFMDLEAHHCRYSVTESSPHFFCGHSVQEDSSYCAFHHELCRHPA